MWFQSVFILAEKKIDKKSIGGDLAYQNAGCLSKRHQLRLVFEIWEGHELQIFPETGINGFVSDASTETFWKIINFLVAGMGYFEKWDSFL